MAKLLAGYSIIMKQKVGNVNTPLYPFTATENVFDKDGASLTSILAGINARNFVPDYSQETTSSLRFLRNDNTWQTIQSASTSQQGVVQLTNAYSVGTGETASETLAATQKAVVDLKDALESQISSLDTDLGSNYVKKSQLGVATSTDSETGVTTVGVATLDTNGTVPATQLPSYVDDVLEGYLHDGTFYATKTDGDPDPTYSDAYTPESGKIYVDVDSKLCYRYAGSQAGYVEISKSLAIGTTVGTAYDGAAGQALADRLSGISAGANKVEASETNGNIKIDGVETTVYTISKSIVDTAQGASSSVNNGYMTTAQYDKLDGISTGATKVEASLTTGNIKIDSVETTVVPQATDSVDGYITAEEHVKLGYCMETAVSATANAPSFTNGLWFEEVAAYAPNPDPEPEPEP